VLIGLGVISTMAFTLNDGPDVQTEVYEIDGTAATGSITKIKVKTLGSLDKVKLDFTLTGQSVAYDLDIDLIGSVLDLTGATITGSSGTAGTHILSDGTNVLYFTAIPSGSSWDVTIDASGIIYAGDNTVWEDITSLLVTLADN
jgi:hypothetical protein